jgi:hypothetical protein
VQLRREADLGVHHAVVGEVLGALGRDALQRILGLHDAHGVCEGLEVQGEVVAVGAALEPRPQLVDVGGGELLVALLGRELDDRSGSDTTVEMVVEHRLRCSPDLFRSGDAGLPAYLTQSRPGAAPFCLCHARAA